MSSIDTSSSIIKPSIFKSSNEIDSLQIKTNISESQFSFLNNLPDFSTYYSNIQSGKIKSLIPGIFIAFDKINDYFTFYYQNQNYKMNQQHQKKIITSEINELKNYVENETLINEIIKQEKSFGYILYCDLILYFLNKNENYDSLIDKDFKYFDGLFLIVHKLCDIEFDVEKNKENFLLEHFCSIFYFFTIFNREIYHLMEILIYLNIKFLEKKIINGYENKNEINENNSLNNEKEKNNDIEIGIENSKEFFDLFLKFMEEKKQIYQKQNLLSIYLFNETIFDIIISNIRDNLFLIPIFKNIIPECITLNKILNLNGREIFTFIEILKTYEMLKEKKINDQIIKEIIDNIIIAGKYEITIHKNIYLNEQNIKNDIFLIDEDEIKNEEIKNLITNLKELYKIIYEKLNDDIIKSKLIVEILTEELNKYNNDVYYIIILKILLEYNGIAFEYSRSIFEIILKKYLFRDSPTEENKIKEFIEKIVNKNESFIKNYYIIILNEKLKIILEEIIQQIFGFYFNGFFMKYTDKINNIIEYKNLDINICQEIFEKNLPFFKASLNFLENELINNSFENKMIGILFCIAFVQSYLFHLVKYIYENKDEDFNQLYNYEPIIDIINGEEDKKLTPFKMTIKTFFFRLLYYNCGPRNKETYEKFKNFDFEGRKIKFREQFEKETKFEDSVPRLITYSKICVEDFNKDEISKGIFNDNEEKYKNLFKIFYKLSDNSISFISDTAYKNGFISEDDKTKIYKENRFVLEEDSDMYNYQYSDLEYYNLSVFTEKLKNKLDSEKSKLGNFEDSNKMFNHRILGILIFSFRISFISQIKKEKDLYFYGKIISDKTNSSEVINLLNKAYIPGFNSSTQGLNNQNLTENSFNNICENRKILDLCLRFILYSHLFHAFIMNKISESNMNTFTIDQNNSCLQVLIKIYNNLENVLNKKDIGKIEIFLNLLTKHLPKYLEIYSVADSTNNYNSMINFENQFNELINKCIENMPEYQMYYFDYEMKYIIQETNNPLLYNIDKYPYMKYFVVQAKPNCLEIKNKLNNNKDKYPILDSIFNNNNDFKCFDNFVNYNFIVNYLIKILSYSINYENISSKKLNEIDEIKEEFNIITNLFSKNQNDQNLKQLIENTTVENLNNTIINHYNKFINSQNNFLENNINNDYCFRRIFRDINIQNALNEENINFNLSSISNYNYYHEIYYKYFERKVLGKMKRVDYFHYQHFEINLDEIEKKLFCILFYRKKKFNTEIHKIIYRYDGLNKTYGEDNDIEKFLNKYPRISLSEKLIQNFIKSLILFEQNKFKKLYDEKKNDLIKKSETIKIEINQKENEKKEIIRKPEENEKLSKEIEKLKKDIEILNEIEQHLQKEEEIKNQIQEKEKVEEENRDKDGINNLKEELTNLQKEIENKKSNITDIKDKEISQIKDEFNKKIEENQKKIEENGNKEQIEKKVYLKEEELKLVENKKKLNEFLYKKLNNCMEELNKVYNNDFVLSENDIKILLDLLFSIQFLFKYLVKYNLPENIPLFFIYENLFENFKSIKQISKLFYQNPGLELKHLYSLYEYLELHLFPFFLNQINDSYKDIIPKNSKFHINKLLKEEEFKKNIIFNREELIEAIRKFMCRYLVSKDKSIVENAEDNLLKLLSKKELWPQKYDKQFSLIKESLESLNKFLIKPILVKNTINLFDILLEINPNNTNERTNLFMQKQQNFANITVQFIFQTFQIILNKNKFGGQNKSIGQKIDNLTSFIENPDSIIEFKELKQYEIGITNDKNYYICKLDNNKIITSHRGNPLKVLSYDENTFRYQKRLTKLEINGLNDIEDSNNVNCIKILRDNSIVLCCFEKPKIIILKIENNTANLIQTLDGSSYSCGEFYNCFEFDYDKLVTSSQQNIIIWKRESNNNSFEYYNKISTNYNTNIVYINDLMFAAYVSDNTIRFYNNEFSEIGKIDNIKSAFDPLSLCVINNEILGVVGRENHSIYLIDINNKKLIKESNFENYNSDFLSLSVLLDNTIIANDSSKNCLHLKLVKNSENNEYDLKLINSLKTPNEQIYTFEYLFEEIFIVSSVNGHFYGYFREI